MKLYGYPPTRTIRALWMLRELDLDFEYVQVDPTKGEHRRPEFLAINPAGLPKPGHVAAWSSTGQVVVDLQVDPERTTTQSRA